MDKIQFHEENKQFAFYLDYQLNTEKFQALNEKIETDDETDDEIEYEFDFRGEEYILESYFFGFFLSTYLNRDEDGSHYFFDENYTDRRCRDRLSEEIGTIYKYYLSDRNKLKEIGISYIKDILKGWFRIIFLNQQDALFIYKRDDGKFEVFDGFVYAKDLHDREMCAYDICFSTDDDAIIISDLDKLLECFVPITDEDKKPRDYAEFATSLEEEDKRLSSISTYKLENLEATIFDVNQYLAYDYCGNSAFCRSVTHCYYDHEINEDIHKYAINNSVLEEKNIELITETYGIDEEECSEIGKLINLEVIHTYGGNEILYIYKDLERENALIFALQYQASWNEGIYTILFSLQNADENEFFKKYLKHEV